MSKTLNRVDNLKNLRMKKLLMLVMLLITSMSFSQLTIDEFYEDKEVFLIHNIVKDFDSISQYELIHRIKDWGRSQFISFGEVLVSESNNQIIFNYMTKSFVEKKWRKTIIKSWYIKMAIDVADNKISISLYDDGNSYWEDLTSTYKNVVSTSSNTYKFKYYFLEDGTTNKKYFKGISDVKGECIKISNNLIEDIE